MTVTMRNRILSVLAAAAALAGAAEAQVAGSAGLADALAKDVSCGAGSLDALRTRVGASSADKADIGEALRAISQKDGLCASVREAASNLVDELFRSPSAVAELGVSPVAAAPEVSALIADAFIAADRAAARLTFESPPPPRHLTRGRISTP